MSEYKGIHGAKVQTYNTDPDNPIVGQVWFNATSGTLKVEAQTTAGSWSTGGALNTARLFAQNGAGTQIAGLAFGGLNESAGQTKNETEKYNGTAWTEVNNLNTARYAGGGGGTQTSALFAGGQPGINNSESWNGTNWTNTPTLNTGRGFFGAANQSATAGLVFGGLGPPGGVANTELYNGSSWSEVNDLNTARRSNPGVGSSSAGFCMGGNAPGNVSNCESWNGTNWTEVADPSNTGGGSAFGSLASCVKTSGNGNVIELWNGTSWSAGTNSPVSVSNRAGLGTSSLGLLAGGEPPNAGVTTVNEYLGPGVPLTRTIDTD